MRFTKFTSTLLLFIGIHFSFQVKAQVKINEYSGANVTAVADLFGNTPDWIELYNAGASTINIGGYYLTNDAGNLSKWQFPIGTTIASHGFLKIFASGANIVVGNPKEYHTNFKITQTWPDKILLVNTLYTIIDSLTIHPNQKNHSWGRTPDGDSTWKVYKTPTFGASNTGTSYINYKLKPVFSVPPGTCSGAISLVLTSPQTTGTKIKYTKDGSDPNTSPTVIPYTAAIPINSSTMIRAICFDSNLTAPKYVNSFIETNTYFIAPDNAFTFPVVSVCFDSLALYGGTMTDANIEYFEKDKQFIFETYGSANIHANGSAFPQKGFEYDVDDEFGYAYTNKHQFFDDPKLGYSPRKEFQDLIFNAAGQDEFPKGWAAANKRPCHLRDAFCQSYALRKNFNLDGRRYEPVIMFLDGKYWGIYELRELFDTASANYYYDQPAMLNLQCTNGNYTPASSVASQTDWTTAYNLVMNNPMNVQANYQQAGTMIDFKSLIDFFIYNTFAANGSIINNNTAWWRGTSWWLPKGGKWKYWMWDMDNTFGASNSGSVSNTSPTNKPCDYNVAFPPGSPPQTGHAALITKLLTNDEFKTLFLNRYADLLNTSLSCDSLLEHLSYFKDFLTPEMTRHVARWAGTSTAPNATVANWNRNIDSLQSWIQQRCKYIDSLVAGCYGVAGPYDFCLEVFPPNSGNIVLNTITVSNFTFNGQYYGGVNMSANALANTNYYFDHWEPTNFTIPDSLLKNAYLAWKYDSTSTCLKAVFRLKEAFNTTGEPLVPTGFSPNGDGNNDILNVYGTLNSTKFDLEIYNRWGQLVFKSTDKSKGWNGQFNGAEAPVGVYAYFFNVTIDGTEYTKKGNITLIR